MRTYIINTLLFAGLFLTIASCKKESTGYQPETMAPLSIEFDNIAGDANLQLSTGNYKNAVGETFSVNLLKYFISNIKVTTSAGTTYTVNPDSSYFLVNESEAATRFANIKVPEGEYSKLSFVLGVDSLRSTMDISKRTGVLDPTGGMDGMYWTWNSGYIFFKMEGASSAVPATVDANQKFRFHVGGFGGYSAPTINNIKTINVDLTAGGVAKVRTGRNANIHLLVDIMKVFNGTTNVSLANNSQIMFSTYSLNVANNYAAMFHHDHTEN
ncbi:hypothetical protein HNQ91_002483 [Filimonas zeae]|uniref:Copper-binding protein MbnP-like domain-containing protein n=1 Tax=Filimonas zeae TaxID=1737353 RepID=A0A917IWE7_9BACT|nr:MbnP family protein [Filimonas zeae]MDR6339432.1 hypothetical protein [Filimonas zeae]GGH63621.1 hypothetical protein GCM10011379_14740 [Filimonas zeae]